MIIHLLNILTEGYILLALALYVASSFSWKYASDCKIMLSYTGLFLSIGLIGHNITDIGWRVAIHSDYNQYAFSKMTFGQSAWVWWVSALLGLLVIALNFHKRLSVKLVVIILSIVAVLYNQFEFWINKEIFNSSEFVSVSWHPTNDKWYDWLYHYSIQSAICLFIISILMLWKFIRNR